ncbi:Tol-Pal system beta propeller repeat protein TolB [Methylosinus sp. RM1]|uniref:Tol-Pal system beta propeller repeat protein TolB n=1 Tax=Methylosinus sp. RM1 TaxID=2583817 RepID=UPI001409F4EF|nr:Tol-Pal system beta propeller repeat protein TolB [Methylosinus sp. RM1]
MTFHLSRRSAAGLIAGAALSPLVVAPARAARVLDLRAGGGFQPVSVAVTNFSGDEAARIVTSVIVNNFKRSVFLRPIEPGAVPEPAGAEAAPNLDLFRSINAQYVVTGRSQRGPDGRLKTEFRLFDVSTGEQATGQQYVTDSANMRRVAHLVSDAVFTRITGEKGFFDTRIVFVDESGPKEHRRKRLAIMDQDGANVRYLTRGEELVVTPRFSPSSQDVTYMSFGSADPKVLLLNIESGQREVVGNFPGMTFSPRFSPDGQKIVMSLSQGAATNLYAMDIRSRTTTRLTDTNAIDTSPSYSPSGGEIVFESDRGGSQQIYVMGASGGGARRISFGQGHYSTPVWSPKGDYIAFTKQFSGSFGIGVMKPDGSGERILTEGFHNEGPTWAPNGLFLMFFRDPGGGGGARIYMVDIFGRSEFPVPTPSYASDPSWGPLQD